METKLSKNLGKRIKELRLSIGKKQWEIADILEMERSNYTRIESGKQCPNDANLEKIALALNVEIKDLFDFGHIQDKGKLQKELYSQISTMPTEKLQKLKKFIRDFL